jgi:predicted nucleotidyltransferase
MMKCPRCTGKGCPVCDNSGSVFSHPGDLPWLEPRIVLYMVHGSRAYGTNRPDSDYDFKGVAVPPAVYRGGFLHRFDQAEVRQPIDAVVFSIAKFIDLAANCNPNIIEIAFAHDEDVLICTPVGRQILDARDMFLSKKALGSFRGYAMSQLARIKTHRKWLLDPPKAPPTREAHDLKPLGEDIAKDQLLAAQSMIQKRMDGWAIDFEDLSEASKIYIFEQIRTYLAEVQVGSDEKFLAAGRLVGFSENFLDLLRREKEYKRAADNWRSYQDWKKNRNETRAELEAKHGYDSKHAMHLVRLMRMCREILTEGIVRVRRPDAEELLSIRDGAWTYDQLIEWAKTQNTEMIEIARTSKLKKNADRKALDRLCRKLTAQASEGDNWDSWWGP